MRGRRRGGHPSFGLLLGSVPGDRLAQKLVLVLRGTPAAVDVERDSVVRGVRRGPAQGRAQVWIEVRHGRNRVVEDGHAVGYDTVGLADPAAALTATSLRGRRGRGRRGGRR